MKEHLKRFWRSLRAAYLAFVREWRGDSPLATCRVWTGDTLASLTPATPYVNWKNASRAYASLVVQPDVLAIRWTDDARPDPIVRERQK